jgi:sulfate adenylyltransferase subunit 1 (EFTu-like GTPase family)
VAYVIRPRSGTHRDFRGYAGKLASGVLRIGDPVVALPSGVTSRIRGMFIGERAISVAHPHMSITLTLEDDIDLSRGDVLVPPDHMPMLVQELEANLCWFDRTPGTLGHRYVLKHLTREVPAVLSELHHTLDMNSLEHRQQVKSLAPNDIARVSLALSSRLPIEPYPSNSSTGSFLLINPQTHATVAAGFFQ